MAKTMIYGDPELKNKLTELSQRERIRSRARLQRSKPHIICEAWDRVLKDKNKIQERNQYDIFKMEYWQNTINTNVDLITGKKIRKGERLEAITQKLKNKFEMDIMIQLLYSQMDQEQKIRYLQEALIISRRTKWGIC